jgi:hypothetical protein
MRESATTSVLTALSLDLDCAMAALPAFSSECSLHALDAATRTMTASADVMCDMFID